MHPKDNPDSRENLVLEQLPSGAHVWLRPDSDDTPYEPTDRFWITDKGRLALAEAIAEEAATARASEEALEYAISVLVGIRGEGDCRDHPVCLERSEAIETLSALRAALAEEAGAS